MPNASTEESYTVHVHTMLTPSDKARIDAARGHEPASSWVRRVVQAALDKALGQKGVAK